MSSLWYLSFADDDGFRGAAYVHGINLPDAIQAAWAMDCNPGGEVFGGLVPDDVAKIIGREWIGRLLDKAELRRMCTALGFEDTLVKVDGWQGREIKTPRLVGKH